MEENTENKMSAEQPQPPLEQPETSDSRSIGNTIRGLGQRIRSKFSPETTTSSSPDSPEAESLPWKGLIFDDPNELTEKVGVNYEIANLLTEIHLWDEVALESTLRDRGNLESDQVKIVLNQTREYRINSGFTLELTETELAEKFGDGAEILAGMDLANSDAVEAKSREKHGTPRWDNKVHEYIWNLSQEHRTKKAEQEGTSWNESLAKAGQSLNDFFKKHGKGLYETTKPRDWREWLAIGARGASDFDSRIGLLLATSNIIAIGAKEIRTYKKLASDLKEKDPQTSTLSEWFSQTTLGKILAEESETDLSKESRRWAGVIGASSSLFGVTAGETAGVLVTAPGASGVARAAILRACTQYVTPRVIDYATSKLVKFEKEEQREEFVNLAIRSSSLTTIFFTTITTGIAVGGTLGPQITDSLENLVESIEDTYEDITEQLLSLPEGEPVLEGQRSPFAGIKTDTELPEAATKPTIPQESDEQPPTPEATPAVQEVSPNEYHFKDGSYAKYGSDGKPTEVVLADGRDLLFAEPEDSRGIIGIQGQLLEMHKGKWSPDEIAVAAQRLASEGVTSDQLDEITNYPKPEMPEVFGTPVEGSEIKFDINEDGNSDAHWEVDKDGNIVGGVDSNGKRLIFDVKGEGTPHLQKELANMHPDWNPDEVEVAAYRDGFLKGNNPNNPEELESIEKPTIEPQVKVTDTTNLVKDRGFDEDGDGIEDSHWLENKETGEIEAGILPDGRVLYLGEEGGITGQVQEVLVHENPNLSPEKVGTIAHNVVVEHEINTSEKTVGVITQPEVISTVNADVARYSLQDYLKDRFNLNYTFAHELAFDKIKLDVRNDSLVKLGPGTEALDFLNARVQIGTGIYNWRVFGWKDWLTEQGMLN